MVLHPHPTLLSEVGGILKENGSNEVNIKLMRDIAQTGAGTEYNSLSFKQHSLCIGRIKHLWCLQTLNPSHKALLCTIVGTLHENRIHATQQVSRLEGR